MDATYELISNQTLTSNQSTIIFSSIPQIYKDLVLLCSARTNRAENGDALTLRFNGNAGNNYSTISGFGGGSTFGTSSIVNTNISSIYITQGACAANDTANTFGSAQIYIPNYSNNFDKSVISYGNSENNANRSFIAMDASSWSVNQSINQITLAPLNGTLILSGSTFYLYGIKNADDGGRGFFGPAMTGGTEVYTTGNGYKVHVFKNSGTLNVTAPGEVEYLVIAGGGGGGASFAGGGGAGGYRSSVASENSGGGSTTEPKKLINPGSYSVIVGAGGTGGSTLNVSPYTNTVATAGNQSSFIDIVSVGGGRSPYVQYADNPEQAAGGSGAGGNGASNSTRRGGYGVSGQGTNGGNGIDGGISTTFTGGGGGAGSVGGTAVGTVSGNGGSGIASSITGSSVARAGGGGGGLGNTGTPGTGGSGGGGNASTAQGVSGISGTTNTGSGGGGGSYFGNQHQSGGNGGSGIVIIRYRI